MQGLAAHETSVDEKDEDDGVELERGALEGEATGQVVENPAAADPPGHDAVNGQGRGDRRAFEVAGFAGGVLGDGGRRRRHVEPG